MKAEDFAQQVKVENVEENIDMYREFFNGSSEGGTPYWIRAYKLYRSLTEEQKEIFFEVIRQIEIDTISGIFAIIDGVSSLRGQGDDECAFYCGPDRLDPYLQDSFLVLFEDKEGHNG